MTRVGSIIWAFYPEQKVHVIHGTQRSRTCPLCPCFSLLLKSENFKQLLRGCIHGHWARFGQERRLFKSHCTKTSKTSQVISFILNWTWKSLAANAATKKQLNPILPIRTASCSILEQLQFPSCFQGPPYVLEAHQK